MIEEAGVIDAFHDSAEEVVLVVDATTGKIVGANAPAVRAMGYALSELEGLELDRVLRQSASHPLEPVSDPSSGLLASTSCNLQLVCKDGQRIAVNVLARRFEKGGNPFVFLLAWLLEARRPDVNPGAVPAELEYFPTIIGRSESIRDICRLVGSVAKSNISVLIQGESGTGKEIVANAIHAHSRRSGGPWVKVNCAALTETLLESELFGHVKGAFTGAVRDHAGRFKRADGGTILLDEIGSMSLSGQAKLLRVLQEREFEPVGSSATSTVDVRVIAATNADLVQAVKAGRFREDLYYRLNVCLMSIPPLRERKEDVALLSQHFLRQCCRAVGKEIQSFAADTRAYLNDHSWPGNVRELRNAVEHAVIVEQGPVILPASLPMNLTRPDRLRPDNHVAPEMGLRDRLQRFERQVVLETLWRANWIKKHAAAMLGIDPRNMPYLLRKHQLAEGPERMRLSG